MPIEQGERFFVLIIVHPYCIYMVISLNLLQTRVSLFRIKKSLRILPGAMPINHEIRVPRGMRGLIIGVRGIIMQIEQ